MHWFFDIGGAAWMLLLQSSVPMLLGLAVAGILQAFLSPAMVSAHLGQGRVAPVVKAALWGIPLPLCSCSVLPAAAQLRHQGANKGATTAFLIATPESGVDSIAVSWALLDPLLTLARPIVAFVTAVCAGVAENFMAKSGAGIPGFTQTLPSQSMPVTGCSHDHCHCKSTPTPDEGVGRRLWQGLVYAGTEIWQDLAGWFFVGLLVAAAITVLVPTDLMTRHLGGGLEAMLLMLAVGMPTYVCATASTPIASALILKGASPGAALVFLLAGPATNVTTLVMISRLLGPTGTAIYLGAIAGISVLAGLLVDMLYLHLGLSASATIGAHQEILPQGIVLAATVFLIILSLVGFVRHWRRG